MEDTDVRSRDDGVDGPTERLSMASSTDLIAGSVRRGWRRGLVVLLVACLACAAGITATYATLMNRQHREPHLTAALYEAHTSDSFWSSGGHKVPMGVRILNTGSRTVTVEHARLSRPGFAVVSGGLGRSRILAHNAVAELSYTLSPDCSIPQVKGPTLLRLTVRTSGAKARTITVAIPQPADNESPLVQRHFQACFAIGSLQLTTLHASTSGRTLTLRVRLAADPLISGTPPRPVKLRTIEVSDAGKYRTRFHASKGSRDTVDLPATGTLQIKIVGDCAPVPFPLGMDAEVDGSDKAIGTTAVGLDPTAAAGSSTSPPATAADRRSLDRCSNGPISITRRVRRCDRRRSRQ